MLPSPIPITILDSVSEPSGTPLWVTIVGWIIALIPSAISIFSLRLSYKNKKKIKTLEDEVIEQFNKKLFYDSRPDLMKKLRRCQKQIDNEHFTGKKTFSELRNAMALAQNLAKLRNFSDEDKKVISDFNQLISDSANLSDQQKDWNAFSQRICDVTFIFQKGDYQL